MPFKPIYSQDYFFEFHKRKRGYLVCNKKLLYIPFSERDKVRYSKKRHGSYKLDHPSAHVIDVADCYIVIEKVFLQPSINGKRKFRVIVSAISCKYRYDKNPDDFMQAFDVEICSNRLLFDVNQIIQYVTWCGFHVYDRHHFKQALSDLFNSDMHHEGMSSYFFIGYKPDYDREDFDFPYNDQDRRLFLPYTHGSDISLNEDISDIHSYLEKQPSAYMLFAYVLLSITDFFIRQYWLKNEDRRFYLYQRDYTTVSLKYYNSNLRQVRQDVNLFYNFFNTNTPVTVTSRENIVLDSAGYDIDNHVMFKDITLIVTQIKTMLSPHSKEAEKIVQKRSENIVNFFQYL